MPGPKDYLSKEEWYKKMEQLGVVEYISIKTIMGPRIHAKDKDGKTLGFYDKTNKYGRVRLAGEAKSAPRLVGVTVGNKTLAVEKIKGRKPETEFTVQCNGDIGKALKEFLVDVGKYASMGTGVEIVAKNNDGEEIAKIFVDGDGADRIMVDDK